MAQTHRSGGFSYGSCDRCGAAFKRAARGQPYKYCGEECAVEPLFDRLTRNLHGSSESGGCLVWTGRMRGGSGYGAIQHNGKILAVHRLVYELMVGPIPEGQCVCHKCDNPACARVDHLFLGTHTDNMRDMVAKGRNKTSGCRGESHGAAKLNDEAVRAIYADHRSQSAIAASFGVSQTLVSQVKRRLIWRHVHDTTQTGARAA